MAPLFAFLHHLAAFTLFAALVVELILIRERADGRHRAQACKSPTWCSAFRPASCIVVGLLRVFYFEKGATYYFHTWTFIAKLTLFIIIGLVSIVPTREFLSWRKAVKQGQAPSVSADEVRTLRSIIHLELVGVVLIILMAALMAKGDRVDALTARCATSSNASSRAMDISTTSAVVAPQECPNCAWQHGGCPSLFVLATPRGRHTTRGQVSAAGCGRISGRSGTAAYLLPWHRFAAQASWPHAPRARLPAGRHCRPVPCTDFAQST